MASGTRTSRFWGFEPEAWVGPGRMSAALWSGGGAQSQEIWAAADSERHTVSIAQNDFHATGHVDGRLRIRQRCRRNSVQILEAGGKPRCVFSDPWRLLTIYVPHALLADTADVSPGSLEIIDPRGAADRVIAGVADGLLGEMRNADALSPLRTDVLIQELCVQILRAHSNVATRFKLSAVPKGGLTAEQLRRVRARMTDALRDEPCLPELASLTGLSPAHFCRAFAVSTGSPPHRWMIQHRLERARDLLAVTDIAVAEVAAAIGYDDPSYFARLFRRTSAPRRLPIDASVDRER